jgi:hypothetical protein
VGRSEEHAVYAVLYFELVVAVTAEVEVVLPAVRVARVTP